MHSTRKACAAGGIRNKQQQTIPLRGRPGVAGYAGGKISACCLVYLLVAVPTTRGCTCTYARVRYNRNH